MSLKLSSMPSSSPKSGATAKWWQRFGRASLTLIILLSALWLIAALWYQLHQNPLLCWPLMVIVALLALTLILARHSQRIRSGLSKTLSPILSPSFYPETFGTTKLIGLVFAVVWLTGLVWFMSIAPQSNRDWKPEVAKTLSFQRNVDNPDLITLHNVRNFDWLDADHAAEHWQTRQVDLSKLSGVDVVNTYWMGPTIAHTLVSFRFQDERPLAFSFEIRKERHERFSAIGGFFKQYELSLIAAEERDIIYTRTNARGEQVYLFPIDDLSQQQLRGLFESYLAAAEALEAEPAWYNTLTSNCTNIIFYMARIISDGKLPWDYRIWASGYLPNYLYDMKILPNTDNATHRSISHQDSVIHQGNNEDSAQAGWSMSEWYQAAHLNPRTQTFSAQDNQSLDAYSTLIRQGLPEAKLKE